MFNLRKFYGRIRVKCPNGEELHFMSVSAALEFVRLATEGGTFNAE